MVLLQFRFWYLFESIYFSISILYFLPMVVPQLKTDLQGGHAKIYKNYSTKIARVVADFWQKKRKISTG